MAALPFLQTGDLRQAAVQLQGITEGAGAFHLFEYHAHPVGEGPEHAACDSLGLFTLGTYLGALLLQGGGIGRMPGEILARKGDGTI